MPGKIPWWKFWKKAPPVGDVQKQMAEKKYELNQKENEFPFPVTAADQKSGKITIPINDKGWPSSPILHMVPLQGNFVAFPLSVESSEKRLIVWSQDNELHSANYYRIQCWYGKILEDGMIVYGETVIFVAAEYIEERFHGAFTTGKHLADINSEVPDNWAIMEIDTRFQYGQSAKTNPEHRWLVYHPPAGDLPDRKIFQHRFGQNEFLGVVNDVITAAVSVKDARVSVPAVILARLKVEAEKLTGDPLRTFKKVSEDDNPLLYRQDLKYQDVIRGKQPAGDITSLGPSEAGRGKMVGSEQIKTIGAPNQPIRAPNQA